MKIRTETVAMPEWVWGRLATLADHKKITVADYIADTLMKAIGDDPRLYAPRKVHVEDQPSSSSIYASTGAPGRRAEVLAAEVRAAQTDGYRSPKYESRKRSAAA